MSVIDRAKTWLASDKGQNFVEQWLRGGRVLKDELGGWPHVYRFKGGDGYVIVAKYRPPALHRAEHGLAVLVGVGVFVWFVTHAQGRMVLQYGLLSGLGFGVITWLVWQLVVRDFLKTTITFWKGNIAWRGGFKRGQIKAGEAFVMEVRLPHRKAAAEKRRDDASRFIRKPLYGVASELLVQSGPRRGLWRPIAAFDHDESGERANLLSAAIDRAHALDKEETTARAAGTKVTGDSPQPGQFR